MYRHRKNCRPHVNRSAIMRLLAKVVQVWCWERITLPAAISLRWIIIHSLTTGREDSPTSMNFERFLFVKISLCFAISFRYYVRRFHPPKVSWTGGYAISIRQVLQLGKLSGCWTALRLLGWIAIFKNGMCLYRGCSDRGTVSSIGLEKDNFLAEIKLQSFVMSYAQILLHCCCITS